LNIAENGGEGIIMVMEAPQDNLQNEQPPINLDEANPVVPGKFDNLEERAAKLTEGTENATEAQPPEVEKKLIPEEPVNISDDAVFKLPPTPEPAPQAQPETVLAPASTVDISDSAPITPAPTLEPEVEPTPAPELVAETVVQPEPKQDKQERRSTPQSVKAKAIEWYKQDPNTRLEITKGLFDVTKLESPKPANDKKVEVVEKTKAVESGVKVLEHLNLGDKKVKAANLHENRMPGRIGFGTKIETLALEKRESGSDWIVEVKNGDGLYNIVNDALEKYPDFQDLDEKEKIVVVESVLKDIEDKPAKYGISRADLKAGDKLNLNHLISDNDQAPISQFIKKAQSLTGDQKKSIWETHAKVSTWVKNHPHEEITADKVNEILNTKIEVPSPEIMAHFEPALKKEIPKETLKVVEQTNVKPLEAKPVLPIPPKTVSDLPRPTPINDFGFKEAREAAIHEQMPAPRSVVPPPPPTPPLSEPAGITKVALGDNEVAQKVEEAFRSEVDDFYGKQKLFMRTLGTDTPEWKFMGTLPAAKVVEYYESDSSNSNLDPEIVKELTESTKHQKFLHQMSDLIEKTNNSVKPYPNETVEQFFKRLGNKIMRDNVLKAA
jgi:hypothetical protein